MNQICQRWLATGDSIAKAREISQQLRKFADAIDKAIAGVDEVQSVPKPQDFNSFMERRVYAANQLIWVVEVVRLQIESWSFLKEQFKG